MKLSIVFILAIALMVSFVNPTTAATKKPWTFMVYLDGDNNLEPYGIMNVNQMEKVGSTDATNVVVLFDRASGYDSTNGNWTDSRIMYITKDNDTSIMNSKVVKNCGELDMGSGKTLTDFVQYCKDNYPAEHYFLTLWNHGAGWKKKGGNDVMRGVCYDDQSGNHMDMASVENSMVAIKGILGQKLDVLDYDACLMAMLECNYQIKDTVDYMTASEETEPGDGNPYELMLNGLTASTTPEQYAIHIVDSYKEYYSSGSEGVTKSAVDLSKIQALTTAVADAANAMNGKISAVKTAITTARKSVQVFYDADYADLSHLCSTIKTTDTTIKPKLDAVVAAVKAAVINNCTVGTAMKNATGISIYFPSSSGSYLTKYDGLSFCTATKWNKFLSAYYKGSSVSVEPVAENTPAETPSTSGSWWDNWFGSYTALQTEKLNLINAGRLEETMAMTIAQRDAQMVEEARCQIETAIENNTIHQLIANISSLNDDQKLAVAPVVEEIKAQLIIAQLQKH
ncbi:MAG: clostripain-related cysteine peptidase [Candidatus Wallbacteria bacterium]|nr:clostripain-related cysteine peptidase [Candidatus Wallbacteria bacterium]